MLGGGLRTLGITDLGHDRRGTADVPFPKGLTEEVGSKRLSLPVGEDGPHTWRGD